MITQARGNPPFTRYSDINHRQFMALVECAIPPDKVRLVGTMYEFSKYGHRNQVRDGLPPRRYFDHPKECSIIALTELGVTDWRIVTALLGHDLMEDSFLLNSELIQTVFGEEVALDLRCLTKEPKEGYLERLMLFGNTRVLTDKLIDRLHNVRTLDTCVPEKREKQIKETREKYFPLVDHLAKLDASQKWRAHALAEKLQEACEYYS